MLSLGMSAAGPSLSQPTPSQIPEGLVPPPGLADTRPLLEHAEAPPAVPRARRDPAPVEPLDRELFLDPPRRYRPWTRWWWLGNLVEEAELRREIELFARKGFGGVEIQAFSLGDRVDPRPGVRERILRYDSDEFWANVRATLDAARQAGLEVDLNHGSGWPAGGPWVGLEDTYQTLVYGEAAVEGGREIAIALPEPGIPLGYQLTLLLEGAFGSEVISFPVEHRRLVAVVAGREAEAAPEGAAAPEATAAPENVSAPKDPAAGYDERGELVVRDGSETGRFAPIRDRSRQASRGAGTGAGAAAAGAAAAVAAASGTPRAGASAAAGGAREASGGGATGHGAPVALDPTTLRVLDAEVRDGKLRWQAPPGRWRVVAIYAMPGGEAPTLVAAPRPGLVLDHFDAGKVKAHYDYHFGVRTGLDRYWGDPLRGFFNDSLEFKTERHWAQGFLEEFARRRGYDLRPWLPAVFVGGADNFFVSDVFGVHPAADFDLGDDGERVRWDYELTVSELVTERFFDASGEWAAARGLLSRAQGYGMALDAIRAAGHVDIPETEALYGGGSDLFLKLASSGAHLYGRPLVSAESFVWRGAEYRTTPQKVRAAADKLFAAGINHVVWHGTPYRVARAEDDGFGEEGWYPWSLPNVTFGFSTNLSKASPFWRDAEDVNRYLARAQVLLRQGRPEADVLVYYPFLRFPSSFGDDPTAAAREDLFNGWLPEVEPAVPASSLGAVLGDRGEVREDPLVPWLRERQELLESLEEAGLTWEWTNGDALERARWTSGAIGSGGTEIGGRTEIGGGVEVGDGRYGGILIAAAPWMPVDAAEAVARLAQAGAPVFFAGDPPARQPGFGDREQGDARVRAAMVAVVRAAAERRAAGAPPSTPDAPAGRGAESDRGRLIAELRGGLGPSGLVERRASSRAIRHLGRSLGEDRGAGAVVLIRNASGEAGSTEIRLRRSSNPLLLLDAVSGAIRPAAPDADGWVTLELAARDSIFLVAGVALEPTPSLSWPAKWLLPRDLPHDPRPNNRAPDNRLAPGEREEYGGDLVLEGWGLSVEGADVEGGRLELPVGPLFDWRDEPRLRLVSSPGRYRTTVDLPPIAAGRRYVLDLGRVHHAADVSVNGAPVATLLFSPFVADVTAALRPGPNTIEVTVRSPLLNRFIGSGERGDARYVRFAGREPLATGLLGPVTLRALADGR